MSDELKEARVLVAGVGGIGNFVAKILLEAGVRQLDLIDMDTAEVTNLNRQLLFSERDIGRPKALIAAEILQNIYPEALITPHLCRLQDQPLTFYRQFDCIFSGLDNIESRRWLNEAIFQIATPDVPVPFMIDGGTDGFSGHCRVILPHHSPCFECTLDNFLTPEQSVPLCTIAQVPRSNRHCVLRCALIKWPDEHEGEEFDLDRDASWLKNEVDQLCHQYGFPILTAAEQADVLRRVVPAIAGTNHVIAALMVQKGLQLLIPGNPLTSWHWNYEATSFPCLSSVAIERNPDCSTCGPRPI